MCTALANRAATQEEATGLFVAAARGLGCECRTVVALSPVPLRANAAALEKAGILLPPPEELWTVDGVKRNNAVQRSKGKGVKGGKKTLITDKRKSGELKSETTTDSANAGSRFVEPITHWAEVLCRDDGEGTHGGKFILMLVWAISMTSCFVYRRSVGHRGAPRRVRVSLFLFPISVYVRMGR